MITRMTLDVVEVVTCFFDCSNMCRGRCVRSAEMFQVMECYGDCVLLVSKSLFRMIIHDCVNRVIASTCLVRM
jgi:hypothetical protein